jgi:hypothetical protein
MEFNYKASLERLQREICKLVKATEHGDVQNVELEKIQALFDRINKQND